MKARWPLLPLLLFLVALPESRGISHADAASARQTVSILAYGCPFTGAKSVEVFMNGISVHVPAAVDANGFLHFQFEAAPGPLYVLYSVDGQECRTGGDGLVVLPGHDRHMLVGMIPALYVTDWHDRKFVAGVLPVVPVAVSLVFSESAECPARKAQEIPATIDDGAYYIMHGYGRHMFLKLRSGGREGLYIALPDAVPVDSNSEYVRRDITMADLQNLTKRALNESVECITTPSGVAMPFP